MNEEPPSEFDPPPPLAPMPPRPPRGPDDPPPFGLMFLLGIILFILAAGICLPAKNPGPFIIGALLAFFSVFFRGWRGLFVGFLAVFGLLVLTVIVICGNSRPF
jgi:hypothetical protein